MLVFCTRALCMISVDSLWQSSACDFGAVDFLVHHFGQCAMDNEAAISAVKLTSPLLPADFLYNSSAHISLWGFFWTRLLCVMIPLGWHQSPPLHAISLLRATLLPDCHHVHRKLLNNGVYLLSSERDFMLITACIFRETSGSSSDA